MDIKLIKNWNHKGKVVKKGTELTVTNDLARDLIKKKIAKEQKGGLLEFFKRANEPTSDSKDGYKNVKQKRKEE